VKATTAWCLYDVGHSAFATTMMSAVLPIYFASVVVTSSAGGLGGTTIWAEMNTVAMAASAVAAPWLGAVADRGGLRKRLLLVFAVLGVLATASMGSVGAGAVARGALLYIVARFAFASSLVFYDSLLIQVARPEEVDRVSARGYAWGYLGGGVLLALQFVVISKPELVGLASSNAAVRWSFVSVGVWWALFTVPLSRWVPETPARTPTSIRLWRESWTELLATLRHLRRYRDAMRFLVAFWFYNDGIGTIVVMAAAFGSELGLPRSTLLGAILMVQFLGLPFSLLFGRLAERIGTRSAIFCGLAIYVGICVWGFFLDRAWEFWVLAVAVSMAQGGCQALSRSLFSRLIPPGHSAEFFGFYNVSSKFAGILGPLLFAAVSGATGSSRGAILALILLFAIGAGLLRGVDPERAARELPTV
jgi:UMF1 family MFS transporter